MTGPPPTLFRSGSPAAPPPPGRGRPRHRPGLAALDLGPAPGGALRVWHRAAGCHLEKLEVNGRGRGILRPRSGIRHGTPRSRARWPRSRSAPGHQVRAGTLLARIEAPPVLQAQLLEARRQLETIRQHFSVTAALQDQAHAEQARRLGARIAKLKTQIASQRCSSERQERNLELEPGPGARGHPQPRGDGPGPVRPRPMPSAN